MTQSNNADKLQQEISIFEEKDLYIFNHREHDNPHFTFYFLKNRSLDLFVTIVSTKCQVVNALLYNNIFIIQQLIQL